MRSFIAAVVVASLSSLGCGVSPTVPSVAAVPAPTAPVAIATTPIGSPAPPGPPTFALTVSIFRVNLFRRAGSRYFQYEPEKLELIETSGKSGATLQTIAVDAPNGVRDRDCTQEQMIRGQVIGPGKTQDLALTMGYCMPYAVTTAEVSEVSFVATFVDDQGRAAQVQGSVNVADCTLGGSDGLISCQ